MRALFLVVSLLIAYPVHTELVCNLIPESIPKEIQEAAKATVAVRAVRIIKEGVKTTRNTLPGGSGFFVNPIGRVATNSHVIEDHYHVGETINTRVIYEVVLSNCNIHEAKPVFTRKDGKGIPDLALLDIIDPPPGLIPVEFENALPKKTEEVYAIGSPSQRTNTVVRGVVLATGVETIVEKVRYQNMIQASTPIIKGNSGGALLNQQGKVLGMTTLCSAKDMNSALRECSGKDGYFIPSKILVYWLEFFQWAESFDSENN